MARYVSYCFLRENCYRSPPDGGGRAPPARDFQPVRPLDSAVTGSRLWDA